MMPDPETKTPKPPPGHSSEPADKYSVQAHSADLMSLAEIARLWAGESERPEFAVLDEIFQAIGRGEFELSANRREDDKLIPYPGNRDIDREIKVYALGPVRSMVRLSDGTRVTATQVGLSAQGADGRARAAKEFYITAGDLRRWFEEVSEKPLPVFLGGEIAETASAASPATVRPPPRKKIDGVAQSPTENPINAALPDIEPTQRATTEIDAYRTGFPGRPSLKDKLTAEFQRRCEPDEVLPLLKDQAAALREWATIAHSNVLTPTSRTIENHIRKPHREYKSANPTKLPTK